jgi:hypothetical protein
MLMWHCEYFSCTLSRSLWNSGFIVIQRGQCWLYEPRRNTITFCGSVWKSGNDGSAVEVWRKCTNFLLSIFCLLFLVNIRYGLYSLVFMVKRSRGQKVFTWPIDAIIFLFPQGTIPILPNWRNDEHYFYLLASCLNWPRASLLFAGSSLVSLYVLFLFYRASFVHGYFLLLPLLKMY